jgi:hypothetical protein
MISGRVSNQLNDHVFPKSHILYILAVSEIDHTITPLNTGNPVAKAQKFDIIIEKVIRDPCPLVSREETRDGGAS